MNVHLRNTLFYSLFVLCFSVGHSVYGQNIDPPEEFDVIEGQAYDFRYNHSAPPFMTRIILPATTFTHGEYNGGANQPIRVSSNEYKIIYNANKGTTGKDTLTIEYRNPQKTFKKVVINVLPSKVTAEDDFICIPLGSSAAIPIELNDYSNRGVLNITDISVENNGSVTIQNNAAIFTPKTGFEGLANFNYVVCDDVGTCDKATVYVCVGDPNSYSNSEIDLITIKNKPIQIITPLHDYNLTQSPTNGILDINTSNGILYFEPNGGYTGIDQFVYTHNVTGFTKTINVDVLNIDEPNQFVLDDVEYTFVSEPILINILENDYLGVALHNVTITNNPINGVLTAVPGLKGVYTYQPNPGFKGIEEFTYSASSVPNNGNTETGKVNIIVNDFNPAQAVFDLQTPQNTPLVLDYNIAPSNYSFIVTNNGNKGTAVFYPGLINTTINGQNIVGTNLVIYTPNSGATGIDEFEMQYCVGISTNCPTVKVKVDIQSISNSNICFGADCVWAGDANRDGVVDLRDILPTGWCIGDVGVSRANATINPWVGQECSNWGTAFPHTDIDLKHLDSNGDSLINVADTTAISEHYQKNHSLSPEPINFPANIPLFLGSPDTIYVTGPGDIVRVPIILGDPNLPAENMYGLTFSIDFDPSIIDAPASSISFDAESWANYTSPVLSMVKKPFTGRIDAAYTRTNGVTTDGYGKVGAVDFVIIEDLEFQRLPEKSFARISGSYYNGAGVYTELPESLVAISFQQETGKEASAELLVFPNPTSDYLNYRIVGAQEPYDKVEVYDLTGKSILQGTHDQFNGQINTSQYTSGVYVMRVSTSIGVVTKKFKVISGR